MFNMRKIRIILLPLTSMFFGRDSPSRNPKIKNYDLVFCIYCHMDLPHGRPGQNCLVKSHVILDQKSHGAHRFPFKFPCDFSCGSPPCILQLGSSTRTKAQTDSGTSNRTGSGAGTGAGPVLLIISNFCMKIFRTF